MGSQPRKRVYSDHDREFKPLPSLRCVYPDITEGRLSQPLPDEFVHYTVRGRDANVFHLKLSGLPLLEVEDAHLRP